MTNDVAAKVAGFDGPGWLAARRLCHDLKQPVAALLIVASDELSRHDRRGDPAAGSWSRVIAQVSLLAEMIDEGLDPQPVDAAADVPSADVDEAIETVTSIARVTRSADVTLVGGAPGIRGAASRSQVHRIIGNVLDNAVRASGPDGAVRVISRTSRDRALVEVEDTGPGWGRIQHGLGLGLGYVSEAMGQLGGAVTVRRVRSGGTRVRLEFPLAPP